MTNFISTTYLINTINFYNSSKLHITSPVKVIGYSQTMTVSSEIVPFINIYSISFISNNLLYKTNEKLIISSVHTSYRKLLSIGRPLQGQSCEEESGCKGLSISSLMKIRSVGVSLDDSNCGHKLLSSIKYCNISTEACSCYNREKVIAFKVV